MQNKKILQFYVQLAEQWGLEIEEMKKAVDSFKKNTWR